jgi:hypothetical protein
LVFSSSSTFHALLSLLPPLLLISSGCSGGGDSHLLLLLSLLLSSSAAAATFAAALIAADRIDRLVGDSGTSSLLLLGLLRWFGNAGNATTAILCHRGSCRLLRLWSDGFLFL